MTNISDETIDKLRGKVKARIVLPGDPSYDEVRVIWNAMIDRRPAIIVQCAEADDVPHAITFARDNGLELSIRGAGHNIAGNAVCNDGVMIDLSTMANVPMLNPEPHWRILTKRYRHMGWPRQWGSIQRRASQA
jgi:hypothetical protein